MKIVQLRNVAKYRTNNVNHFLSINSSKVRKKIVFSRQKSQIELHIFSAEIQQIQSNF